MDKLTTAAKKGDTSSRDDIQMASPSKPAHKAHRRGEAKTSEKKKKRKGSHSSASKVDPSEEESSHHKKSSRRPRDEDHSMEDYDDSEEYDSEDEENSFIAPDEEVEEELREERRRKHAEEEGGEGGKKKKKKRRVEPMLEEDELELIKENTGLEIKKKKRLLKQSEREREESEDKGMKEDPDEQLFKEGAKGDSDEEMIETSRKRVFRPAGTQKKNYFDQTSLNYVDPDKAQVARNIFDSKPNLEEKRRHQMRIEAEQNRGADLEEMFDANEIDDQFATKQDKQIAEIDIPERLQILIGENRFNPSQEELVEESEWIFQKIVSESKNEGLTRNKKQVTEKIMQVISLFRKEKNDIPYIVKYRRYVYQKDLNEADVWSIFNYDIEFGKFKQQKNNILMYMKTFAEFDQDLIDYEKNELQFCDSIQKLSNYSPFINFLKNYYCKELSDLKDQTKIKAPIRTDKIQLMRQHNIVEAARQCMLRPALFIQNLQNQRFINRPPSRSDITPAHLAYNFKSEFYNDALEIIEALCKFAYLELGAQPYIRKIMKEHFYQQGMITTAPTEQGNKELDIFHPSYRVKRIQEQPISSFLNDDRFIEILQNEKAKFLTYQISLSKESYDEFLQNLKNFYIPSDYNEHDQWRVLMSETLKRLMDQTLIPEITNEIKQELYQSSENCVIQKCTEVYRNLLMTGPFSCEEISRRPAEDGEDIVKDRPRCAVMSVILHQLDSNNQVATIAVVDKYGELKSSQDLMHLMPPRKFTMKEGQTEEEIQRYKKARLSHKEEETTHTTDREKVREMLVNHSVDLIVVGANKLQARTLKETLKQIAEEVSNYSGAQREAFVTWGSLEVPKLFANSHQSSNLLKNSHMVLKAAICLARFQQDPLNEVLNLWSFVPSENSALSLNLNPLQKQINQSKLQECLEEVNIKCVNAVGIDLNLVISHEHMHAQMSFLSGIGPRKARKFIQLLKSKNQQVNSRGEIFKENYIGQKTYLSLCGFIKIRILPVNGIKPSVLPDVLDQTRIHQESYQLALKVARDVMQDQSQDLNQTQSLLAVREVIKNPKRIAELDLDLYKVELEKNNQGNMTVLLDQIIQEFQNPFKDPREYITPSKPQFSLSQLFYMLIDESERSFKRGIIVTATVTRVLENVVLCKLDNGLDGAIKKANLDNSEERLDQMIQTGYVITGRVEEIQDKEEGKFGVALNCKKQVLNDHSRYIPEGFTIPQEDLQNQNFTVDADKKYPGKFQPRRINHPRFKNITSRKALDDLQEKDIGEFVFRPSSKGNNNITLTWKFYTNNFVHIDIEEIEKPPGAQIGSKLKISDEIYESLQEIIERYIGPCNKNLRDSVNHIKFQSCTTTEELEFALKKDKEEEPSRIPYKITCLPQYPQYLVIGYIPKKELVKEYIKVKPKGFIFHEKCLYPVQMVINWFKENFKDREYLKYLKRSKSPKTRVLEADRPQPKASASNQWGEISKEWQPSGANSVHSMNDEPNHHVKSERPYGSAQNQDSGYNQSMNFGGERRGPATCYNCQQTGHMSRECTNPKVERSFGGGGGRGRGNFNDDGRNSQRSGGRGYNNNGDDTRPRNPDQSWGNQNSNIVSQGWGAQPEQDQFQSSSNFQVSEPAGSGGWGNSSPKGNDLQQQPSWGGNDIGGGGNWGDNNGGGSPARSHISGDDRRGRGRGRGSFSGPSGGGGGSRACFKCNQEGHMARECPTGGDNRDRDGGGRGRGQGRGSGGMTCFKCNQEGHMSRECPNGGGDGAGRGRGGGNSRACYKCNEEGHMARECPNPDSRSGNDRGGRGRSRGRDFDRDNGDSGAYKRVRRDDGEPAMRGSDYGRRDNEVELWGAPGGFPKASGQQDGSAWGGNPDTDVWGQESSKPKPAENQAWGSSEPTW